jgi:hypothetical protein
MNHTKSWLKWKLSYYNLGLRLQDGEVEDASIDRTYLQKRLTRRYQGIHLALEVKTFDNSTPVMVLSTESSSQKHVLSTASCQWHHRKREREREKPAHKQLQSKGWVTTLSKTDLTWPRGQLLDMPRLQVVKTHKPTSRNLITFKWILAKFEVIGTRGLWPILRMQV